MKKEIEAKFFSGDKDALREKLKKAGFMSEVPEYMMVRKAFDVPSEGPGIRWARVRQEAAGKITMAIKHDLGKEINDVSEIELIVDDFDRAVQFLEAAGLKTKAFQENLREVWARDDVEAAIDTWPGLSPFIEIEGPSEEIVRKSCEELGFNFSTAIFGGAARMYAKELGMSEDVVNNLPEITFAHPPQRST